MLPMEALVHADDPVVIPDFEAFLRGRRSVRRFLAEAPPRALIERLLDAAITAPSASNKQPWRFFVVESRATIDAMVGSVRQAVDRIARHVPEASEASFRAYGDYFTRFAEAPVVIVPIHRGASILSSLVDDELDADDRAQVAAMERDSGLIGTALALQNLLLAAHALGLGASGMTGPLVAATALKTILGVPESWGIVALVPVGYPAETPQATDRKAREKVVRWIP